MSADADRRDFLRAACRWSCLAALGGWLTAVALRGGDGGPALCARCPALRSCGLARGRRARAELGESRNPRGPADIAGLCPEANDDAR